MSEISDKVDGLAYQSERLLEQAYQRGYKAGYSKAENDYHAQTEKDRQSSYELGLAEAWDLAKRIVCQRESGWDYDTLQELFGFRFVSDIMRKLTATEAIQKIRAYEEKQTDSEIRVGDEVVSNNGDKGIVLCYYHETDGCGNWKEEWLVVYMSDYDVPQTVTKKRFKKTGKHYDVMSILKQMQGGE